ncbi:MAG: hypothetical protein AAF992_00035 [Bacteroidota bacterium]
MKPTLFLVIPFIALLGLSSCFEEPDYDLRPALISFDDFYFVDPPGATDTLVIRVNFQDGDGNLGLTAREGSFFDPFTIRRDINGDPIKFDPNDGNQPPFNCTDFIFPQGNNPIIVGNDTITDTIWIEPNPLVRNFEVTLSRRVSDGVYEVVDFGDPSICRAPLGGRFPPLKDDFSNTKPLEGTIQFSAPSLIFKPLFRNDSLKIGVVIRDRTGLESNMLESAPFTLSEITRFTE